MGCVLAVFAGVWGAITGVSLFAPELAVTISYALVASGLGMAAVGLPVAVEVPVWVAPAVMGTAIVVRELMGTTLSRCLRHSLTFTPFILR